MNAMPKHTKKTNDRAGNEIFFSAILHLAQDAIIVMDEDQNVIIFNEGAERIFAYKTWEVIIPPLSEPRNLASAASRPLLPVERRSGWRPSRSYR